MRAHEVYALRCYACDGAVELLANVDTYCPACLTWLDVQWRGVPMPPGSYLDVPGMNAPEAEAAPVSSEDEAQNPDAEIVGPTSPPVVRSPPASLPS